MSAAMTGLAPGVSIAPVATRLGVKGPGAATWLQQQGLVIPAAPNHVVHWTAADPAGPGRCLRQGSSEFLIEIDRPGHALPDTDNVAGVWTLLREEVCLRLEGPSWPALLNHICSFDFTRLHDDPDMVVMTLAAGIGVTLIREPPDAGHAYGALRLWCDPGYAPYLQQCLHHLGEPR